MKKLILFFDSGDTIIDQGTEVRLVPEGVVQTAECIPGARETVLHLHEAGYRICLVADGLAESFRRMFDQQGIAHCFEQRSVSETVGAEKPDARMFETAMELMSLTDADKKRVIMIGNNVERDIAGANRFGIRSILLTWSPRYRMESRTADETPTWRVAEPKELWPLIEKIEAEIE